MLQNNTNPTRMVMYENDHAVQVYKNHKNLLKTLKSFIGAGIKQGDTCIVVASRPTQASLEASLEQEGFDLQEAKDTGCYIYLDSPKVLDSLLTDDIPNRTKFEGVIGGLLKDASLRGKPIRVYGDMVDFLCKSGAHTAAITLERLWDDLKQDHSFTLLCSYSVAGCGSEASVKNHPALEDICRLHSHAVLPQEFQISSGALPNRSR